jgi:hypothetical protein
MSAKAAVIHLLCRDAGVAAIVGDRVRAFVARETDVFPYIIVSRDSSQPNYHLAAREGLIGEDYSLDLYAETVQGIETLREAVETCINQYAAYHAEIGPDVDRVKMSDMRITNISESYLQAEDGSDSYLYNIAIDVTVWSRDA